MNIATTKRSPVVLIRMLVLIEAIALMAYALTAAMGNYEYDWYPQIPFFHFLSFENAKFLFLSGAQFLITLYAFLRWHRESYSVQNRKILYRRGVIWKREKTFEIEPCANFKVFSGPLGKWLRYGSIRIENGEDGRIFLLKDIPSPNQFLKTLQQDDQEKMNLVELLKREENGELEFKSSLRFDYHINRPSRDLERSTMKTIAAFLNSRGGHCVIGVDDQHRPLGLEHDYKSLQRKDRDGFEIHFTQIFNAMIGPEFRSLVDLTFETLDGAEVCSIRVKPSPRPVYFKHDEHEHFYMRTGNITTALKLSELESYVRGRWPNR